MKKMMRSVVQTINLSNPKTCVKLKSVQKISTNEADSCSDSNRANEYWISRPTTVKICTRKDMQRTCPPKPCDHPPKPLSGGEKLCRIVMFLIKGAITAGLIYWTYSEGFWGDSSKTEDLYYRIMSTIARRADVDNVHLPHLEGTKYSMIDAYNRALVKGMDIIVSVPLEMSRKLRDLLYSYDTSKETTSTRRHSDENPTEI